MTIITKPGADPSAPNSKTTITEDTAGIPIVKTTVAGANAAIPNAKTTIAENTAGIPNSKTTIAEASAGIPTVKTTVAAVNAAIPNSKTTIGVAGIPRSIAPLVNMDFSGGCFAQCNDPVLFEDLFTYSRNSSATFINQRIACGKAEFFLDTDFVGNVTNLALFSEQFNDAAWVKANATVLADNDFNVDGLKIADRLHPASTGTLRGVSQAITATTAEHNVSFRVKAAGFKWIKIFDAANTNGAWFNVFSGIVGTIIGNCEPSIEPLGDDWFRCSIGDAGAVAGFANIILADADNSTTATLSGVDGVLLDAAQLTLGVKPLPYVKTISSTVLQAFTETLRVEYDPVTGANLGAKIEGAITNLLLRSEEFDNASWSKGGATVSANAIMAPDGTFSADKIVEDGTTAAHGVFQGATVVAGAVTRSFILKAAEREWASIKQFDGSTNLGAWFDLINGVVGTVDGGITADIKLIMDGWYLCSVTYTTAAVSERAQISIARSDGDFSYTGDSSSGIYVWAGQMEQLPFSSSYIRTEGSTVSRVADDLNIPVAGNEPPANSDVSRVAKISLNSLPAGGSGVAREVFRSTGISGLSNIRVAPTGELDMFNGSESPDIKADGAFSGSFSVVSVFQNSTNNLQGYIDGAVAGGGDAGNLYAPNVSIQMGIGSTENGFNYLFGHIESFAIYDVALTAQEVSIL